MALLRLSCEAKDLLPDKQQSVSAAARAQGLALELGKGRVVVLGEAAQRSKLDDARFGMNVPGLDNRQFALNVMRWLSRKSS